MSEKPPPDIEEIADLALVEIGKRFEERPQDIPDHVLAKYFTDVNKVIDRRSEKEQEEDGKPFSLKDELDTLPHQRAMSLVLEEIERLEAELAYYEQWLRAEGEANGSDRVGPQEQSQVSG